VRRVCELRACKQRREFWDGYTGFYCLYLLSESPNEGYLVFRKRREMHGGRLIMYIRRGGIGIVINYRSKRKQN